MYTYICCCTHAEYGYAWTQVHEWKLPTTSGLGRPHWYEIDICINIYIHTCVAVTRGETDKTGLQNATNALVGGASRHHVSCSVGRDSFNQMPATFFTFKYLSAGKWCTFIMNISTHTQCIVCRVMPTATRSISSLRTQSATSTCVSHIAKMRQSPCPSRRSRCRACTFRCKRPCRCSGKTVA